MTQAAPGWYESPLGEGETYWDGEQWTEHRRAGAPGWYPNPEAGGVRYFDGYRWTDNYAPGGPVAQQDNDGLITAGWVCALFFPLAGLVIGLILADRNEDQGWWIVLTSLVLSAIGYFLIFGGALR